MELVQPRYRPSPRPRSPRARLTLLVIGIVLVSLAIGTCLLLGTLGWFVVGVGTMTECTDNYSCSATGCGPCARTGLWINVGGVAQLVLAGLAITVLAVGTSTRRWALLIIGGPVLLATSLLAIAGTTWLAHESFCQPGTDGYADSYCSVDD